MKYAIPMSNGTLSTNFFQCEDFAFIDANEASKTITRKHFEPSPGNEPGLLL
ncbi:MAG: hypothetical protein JSV74_01735 [Dehalococcoidia bacterium]|nr:MAG: hypothetical protein JSV74_01735 [Dehalococcoidia bacterium]